MTAFIDANALPSSLPSSCASKLFVCITCRRLDETIENEQARPGARLMKILSELLEAGEQNVEIVPVECLSNCTRGCTVAVSGPGKWTYVIGALDPEQHADDVVRFARLHQAQPDGLPVWRERPVHIRKNTIARVPPLPQPATTNLETASR
jgi:predicted metal-binding protein